MSLLLFTSTQNTVDWSSVMAVQPLTQRVARATGGGVKLFFLLWCIWHWRDGWGENGQHKFWCAAGHSERAPGAGAAPARTANALAAWPLRGADREPHGAWAAMPLHGANPNATWHLGGSSTRGRTQRHLALGSWQKSRLDMAAPAPRGA